MQGLGAILAAEAQAEKKARLEGLDAPPCPLCGEPMTFDAVAWFCYGANGRSKCSKMGVLENTMYSTAPEEYVDGGSSLNPFQGQTFAAIVSGGEVLVEFCSVRGGRGKTNLRLACREGVSDEDVPALAKELGWTWYEWAEALAYDFDPYA